MAGAGEWYTRKVTLVTAVYVCVCGRGVDRQH